MKRLNAFHTHTRIHLRNTMPTTHRNYTTKNGTILYEYTASIADTKNALVNAIPEPHCEILQIQSHIQRQYMRIHKYKRIK